MISWVRRDDDDPFSRHRYNAATRRHSGRGGAEKRQPPLRRSSCLQRLLSSSSSNSDLPRRTSIPEQPQEENDDEEEDEVEYRSIGYYVGGVHGGKYEFDNRISGVTALNYESSIIFDNDDDGRVVGQEPLIAPIVVDDEDDHDNIPPKWSQRPILPDPSSSSSITKTMSLGEYVSIRNEEISWEPFYATVECSQKETERQGRDDDDDGVSSLFDITPIKSGILAPRGGSPNLCDDERPYSDHCEITVTTKTTSTSSSLSSDVGARRQQQQQMDYYLVVRTECDHWCWRLILN